MKRPPKNSWAASRGLSPEPACLLTRRDVLLDAAAGLALLAPLFASLGVGAGAKPLKLFATVIVIPAFVFARLVSLASTKHHRESPP